MNIDSFCQALKVAISLFYFAINLQFQKKKFYMVYRDIIDFHFSTF